MTRFVVGLHEIDGTQVALVGGKAAQLGELSRIEGARVPPGFCVTTDAFRRSLPSIDAQLDRLSRLRPDEPESARTLSAELRQLIEGVLIPAEVAAEISAALLSLGEQVACAVRSSATAEDLPTASFAGQQDTYLNVVGADAMLQHITRCWASLFTERAVTYRARNGFDHRKISMAVVVQQLVFPHAAGTLFTADPMTSNRKVASVEAVFGLGDALVSGVVNADLYRVRDGAIVTRAIARKPLAIVTSPNGGTHRQAIDAERQQRPALTDAQVVQLVELGRQVEAHFGRPQDLEWCLDDDGFHLVQSRPITTLFPIPTARDEERHVYISVGHQQMMTDAMKPLGLSVWQATILRPMAEAGSRLFVDVTQLLASPATRTGFLTMLGKADPLFRDALQTVLDRDDFIRPLPGQGAPATPPGVASAPPIEANAALVTELIARCEASLAALKSAIRAKSGPELIDFVIGDFLELRRVLFDPRVLQVVLVGMDATHWLNEQLLAWLGEKNVADTLTLSAPNNVTSEMGLALLDLADAIRPHPEVVALLQRDDFLDALPTVSGGTAVRAALQAWLEKYGMRCVGEIDVTRPRWAERPGALVPLLLSNVKNFEAGEAARRFEAGRRAASQKEKDVLQRLKALPDGEQKAEETKRMIDRVRTFIGFREYPKYGIVSRYFVYKQALLEEAERLVRAGVLGEKDDLFFLRLEELRDVVRTGRVDGALIRERKAAFIVHEALRPPRVLTSEGEAVAGTYRREGLPAGALAGLAVSSGTVEGRARVILDVAEAKLEPGDILVTTFTDPSWTPLFVAIKGLVTEVGGTMTHGAVIAREYGLPAVVGVERATRLIRDGQRIRVNGTEGFVELLP